MSHLVLYRNFRPKNFDEVIGQDHIVKTLKNQVENNSFGHAYLFCGTRGTGKTSTAKIFARAVNCLNPQNGNPCGMCENCKSNHNGGNLDIIEIDAASNNRVDEIRDLRDKIGYLPSVNKYKVYIVDEVHMLTDSAFNALLKTLEEPPQHALFILATTEPHKLPATILSRCMRFDFKLVSDQDLIKHLRYVFDKSNITYDEESLKLIASAGEGSVRDTLSVAEMCSAYCSNNITYDKCLECLGITDSTTILNLTKCIITKDAKNLLLMLDSLKNQGKNFGVLVKDIIQALNNILTIKLVGEDSEVLTLPKSVLADYALLSKQAENARLVDALKTLSELDYKMKLASSVELLVENTLLSLIYTNSEIDKLSARVDELEKKTVNENFSQKKTENLGVSFDISSKTDIEPKNIEKNTDFSTENLVQKPQLKLEEIKVNDTSSQINSVEFNDKASQSDDLEAKKIFGELLLSLRKNSKFMLYSILGDVKKVEIKGSTLVLNTEKVTFDAVNDNLKELSQELSKLSPSLVLNVQEIKKDDLKTTEQFLIDKFDGKIKIV